jgi:hypothetical protein
MHSLLLVTCSNVHAATSAQARHYVYTKLRTTPLFMDEEHEADQFVCDWFVIGGRYSSILTGYTKGVKQSQPGRDFHRDEGYADDAMLIDHGLYLRLLAKYEGQAIGRRMEQLAFLDMDGERVSPQFIKHKWVVVVDYHS